MIPLTYFFLLPRPSALESAVATSSYDDETMGVAIAPYTPIANGDDDESADAESYHRMPKRAVSLSASDKWRLVRPMLLKYMLPLCEFHTHSCQAGYI